jgi:hypothetical protein
MGFAKSFPGQNAMLCDPREGNIFTSVTNGIVEFWNIGYEKRMMAG